MSIPLSKISSRHEPTCNVPARCSKEGRTVFPRKAAPPSMPRSHAYDGNKIYARDFRTRPTKYRPHHSLVRQISSPLLKEAIERRTNNTLWIPSGWHKCPAPRTDSPSTLASLVCNVSWRDNTVEEGTMDRLVCLDYIPCRVFISLHTRTRQVCSTKGIVHISQYHILCVPSSA